MCTVADDVILETVHGSRLYGLAHEQSDYDIYRVVAGSRKPSQHIADGVDVLTLPFDRFWNQCAKGVPQALEAMFSAQATVDARPWLRSAYRAAGPVVASTYVRTVKSFWLSGSTKRRRHAARLALNLEQLMRTGRFDPTLTEKQVLLCKCLERTVDNYEDLLAYFLFPMQRVR